VYEKHPTKGQSRPHPRATTVALPREPPVLRRVYIEPCLLVIRPLPPKAAVGHGIFYLESLRHIVCLSGSSPIVSPVISRKRHHEQNNRFPSGKDPSAPKAGNALTGTCRYKYKPHEWWLVQRKRDRHLHSLWKIDPTHRPTTNDH